MPQRRQRAGLRPQQHERCRHAITGAGTLAQEGTGTTVLTGVNTYSGTTTIAAGTLQVGNGGAAGTLGGGHVVNNGTLVIDRAGALAICGAVSGSGSLTQAGTGTTVLAARNTYSGTTTIAAGTLQMGNGGGTGSLGTGDVVNRGTLVFNRTGTLATARA